MNKQLIRLLVGQSIANLGDVLYLVGVISLLFTITNSAFVTTLVPFVITTSLFISSILTPLVVARFQVKRILVVSQASKTLFILVLGLFCYFYIDSQNFAVVFLLISLVAFLDGCANPIIRSYLPQLVVEEKLLKANSVVETADQLVQIGSWFLGGMLLLVIGPTGVLWTVGILYVFALVLWITLPEMEEADEEEAEGFWMELTAGWRVVRDTVVLRKIVWMDLLETIAGTAWIAAIIYIYVDQAIHQTEQWWGYLNGAFFVGFLIGSVLCMRFAGFVDRNKYRFMGIGALVAGILTITFGMISNPWTAFILSLGIGLFGQLKNIPQQTIIQRSVSKAKLVTVYTSLGAVATGVFALSSLGVGVLSEMLGVRAVFIVSGILLLTVAIVVAKNKRVWAI